MGSNPIRATVVVSRVIALRGILVGLLMTSDAQRTPALAGQPRLCALKEVRLAQRW